MSSDLVAIRSDLVSLSQTLIIITFSETLKAKEWIVGHKWTTLNSTGLSWEGKSHWILWSHFITFNYKMFSSDKTWLKGVKERTLNSWVNSYVLNTFEGILPLLPSIQSQLFSRWVSTSINNFSEPFSSQLITSQFDMASRN